MTDDVPTSRKVPPLVIIVIVVLAALAAVAFANWRSTQHPPHAGPSMPQAQPASAPVMPQQSTVPDHQAPASDEKGAMGHKNTSDEPGGPSTTANVTGPAR